METVCDGCQKEHNAKGKILNDSSKHNCNCQTHGEDIKIDGGLDQVAADSKAEKESASGKHQAEAAQNQEEMKSGIIQGIKDLPPHASSCD